MRIVIAAALAVALPAAAQSTSKDVLAHLTAGLGEKQLSSIQRGELVVDELPTRERRDVAVIGVVHVERSRAEIVDLARTTIGAAHGLMRQFETPASIADMSALRLTRDDLKGLSRCRQDACNMKLSASDMAELHSIITPDSSEAASRAEEYFRHRLVSEVDAYRRLGNVGMYVYNDRGNVAAGDAFTALVQDSSPLTTAAPELTHFLLDYPHAEQPGESSLVYWAFDSLPRTHPTLRIMHEVIYSPANEPGVSLVANKQVYANHYFEAGLEVVAAVEDSVGRGTTVVILRHYRFDQLPHIAFFDLRGRVVDRLEDAVEKDLERIKK